MQRLTAQIDSAGQNMSLSEDLVWEVAGIASEIGKTPRQTHYMLENGHLPAKKIGGRWCSSKSALRAFFASKFTSEAA